MFDKDTSSKFTKILKNERIFLFGGAGFIGHNLALHLRKLTKNVFVVDNLMTNNLIDNLFSKDSETSKFNFYRKILMQRFRLLRENDVKMINADTRNYSDLSVIFEQYKPTKVIHLSAISSAIKARQNPSLCFDIQLISLKNLLELCRLRLKKVNQFTFLSSSTVYGDFETEEVNENTRPRPRGIYANTKYMGERLVRTYCHQYGLGTTIIRPSALYGERCISKRVSQIFIENALEKKISKLEGGGDGLLDFTYIDDLVQGIIRSLVYHEGHNTSQTFNITFGKARNIKELFDIVKLHIPESKSINAERVLDKPIRGTLSIDRAKKVLKFKPVWPLEKGYVKYIKWFKNIWMKNNLH